MQALIALIYGHTGRAAHAAATTCWEESARFLFNKTYNFAGRKREEAGHFYLQLKISANRFCWLNRWGINFPPQHNIAQFVSINRQYERKYRHVLIVSLYVSWEADE